MEQFALIMLILLIFGWHHLMNYYIRLAIKEDEYNSGGAVAVAIVVTLALTGIALYFIIKWGANLI